MWGRLLAGAVTVVLTIIAGFAAPPEVLAGGNRGDVYEVLGSRMVLRAPGKSFGVDLSVLEVLTAAGGGPPLHVHSNEDEIVYVIEGIVKVWRGDETLLAGPGDTAVLPRGHAHSYKNVGENPARLLVTLSPSGFEDFFAEVSKRGYQAPNDLPEIVELGKSYGLEFLGPPPE